MSNVTTPPLELDWGVAIRPLPGETVSGDGHVVQPFVGGVLLAVMDGLGHGPEAAEAARVATATLEAFAQESLPFLVQRCHAALKQTRGVALSLASLNARDGMLTWLGVGNVEGVLFRDDPLARPAHEYVPQRSGVVGYQLPPLRQDMVQVRPGDTLILATDGIRSGFVQELTVNDSVQEIADRILAQHARDTDDALVLVVRYRRGTS